jgi:hypothetical protein
MMNRLRFIAACMLSAAVSAPAIATDLATIKLGMHQANPSLAGWEVILNRPKGSMLSDNFIAHKGGWDSFEGSAWYVVSSEPTTRRLVLAVGFFPDSVGGSIAQAAAGAYEPHWRDVASQLFDNGFGNAIIRVAWEFDGDWYPWGYGQSAGDNRTNYARYYKQAFQRLVNVFRKVSLGFTFVWNPSHEAGSRMPTYQQTYPGDKFVDCIGPDVYDNQWDAETDPAARWQKEHAGMLAVIATMANTHAKPVCIPEWGAGQGGSETDTPIGDNPYLINAMADWLAGSTNSTPNAPTEVSFASYWSGDEVSGYFGWIDKYPNQRAAYVQRFGPSQHTRPEIAR